MIYINYFQQYISGMLGRCAVPMFFIISGYLYFQKADSIQSIWMKVKKRFQTLLIPYLISSIFFVVFFIIVEIIPGTAKFMNFKLMPLFNDSFDNVLYRIFINFGHGSPIAFQLWFLRDLILIVLFSHILFYAFRYLKWAWLFVVLIIYYYFDVNFFLSLFWFSLGVYIQLYAIPLVFTNKPIKFILAGWFIILSILQFFTKDLVIWEYLRIPIIATGVLAFWFLYDLFVSNNFSLENNKNLRDIFSFTFFIYLFHEPVLNVVRKLIVYFIGEIELGYIVSYLLSPWIFIILSIFIGSILKKYFSYIYSVLVGGRV